MVKGLGEKLEERECGVDLIKTYMPMKNSHKIDISTIYFLNIEKKKRPTQEMGEFSDNKAYDGRGQRVMNCAAGPRVTVWQHKCVGSGDSSRTNENRART